MADTESKLPQEDQADISPDIPGLRTQEGAGGEASGGSAGGSEQAGGETGGGDSHGSSPLGGTDLAEKESAPGSSDGVIGGGFQSHDMISRKEMMKALVNRNKRKALFGGLGMGVIIGIIMSASLVSGPLELVNLSQVLQKGLSGDNKTSSERTRGLLRYAKSGSIGETRVGLVGSKVFGNVSDQLRGVGIDFQTNTNDQVKSATIDTAKLSQKFPELEHMSVAERRSFLADKFSLSESQLGKISGSAHGTKFAVNTRDFGVKSTRALVKNSLSILDDGKVVTAVKFRVMAQFFDLPGLFHPLKRAAAGASDKAFTAAERKTAEVNRNKAVETPVEDTGADAVGSLRGKLGGLSLRAGVGVALLATAGMCIIRSSAGDIVKVNRAEIVGPAAVDAVDKTAVGSQVQSGQDITLSGAGDVEQGFTDSSGQTIWKGKALQVLSGMPSANGQDLSNDYRQAFSPDTTADHIDSYLGGGGIGAVACSLPGQIIQGVIGLGLVISGFLDAGASWGAKAAVEGASAAGTAGAVTLLQHQFVNIVRNKAIFPAVAAGAVGGNLLAYGARESGNMIARSSGGVALPNTNNVAYDKTEAAYDQASFSKESFFARTFDTNDYRSAVSRLADSININMGSGISSFLASFTHVGSLFSTAATPFMPRASAAGTGYDWGFPEYGIPDNILNDPQFADPYANGDTVSKLLDSPSGQTYIDKAKKCFGVNITKGTDGWDAVPQDAVNPNSDAYSNAGCSDLSDMNWERIMVFVTDTQTMAAIDCFNGGSDSSDQSCQNIGFGSPVSTASATTPTPTTGSLSIDNQAAQKAAQAASTGSTKVGYALYDASGNQQASYNASSTNSGASITKSMLLVAYLKQANRGGGWIQQPKASLPT